MTQKSDVDGVKVKISSGRKYLCKKHNRPAVVEIDGEYYCWQCWPGIREVVRKDKENNGNKNHERR